MVTRLFETGNLFRIIQAFVHTHTHTRTGVDDVARMNYEELQHELVKVEGDLDYLTHRFAALQARLHETDPRYGLMECYVGVMLGANELTGHIAAFAQKEGNS